MDRVIKFRVWEPFQNRYLNEDDSYLIDNQGGLWWVDKKEKARTETHDTFYHTIQRFTGLLDKNKKEIYEGDILKGFHWEMPDEEIIDYVTFRCGSFCFFEGYFSFEEFISNNKNPDTLYDFEIIGNIFENPELLK